MFRILIAGLGSIGRRHLANLRKLGVHDIALYRTRPEPVKEAPELPVFTNLTQALATRPDLVIVSNPTAYHLQVALAAAQAGCNLFIEKPLSHSWDGVDELLSLIEKKHLIALVGFDLRFEPGLCRVKELLQEGHIGRLLAIQAQVGQYLPDWHPTEQYREGISTRIDTGGGVLLDLIHELDYVRWLVGPVAQISCTADKITDLEIDTEDIAVMLLRFESGAIGTVHLDYMQRVPSRTCRVIGERGTILWDYHATKVQWYNLSKEVWEEFDYANFQRNDRFLAEMCHLLGCLKREQRPKVDVVEGSKVLKLALAAKESASTGKACQVSL